MAGRPSNRDERYAQVMDALVRCVARLGLDGATLSAVAKEAGLSRPLIRHHLGNRDEIVAALQGYVLQTFAEQTEAMEAFLPDQRPASALVELLFSDEGSASPDLVLAFAALTARASQDPELQAASREQIVKFESAVAKAVQAQAPLAAKEDVAMVAHGIVALYFNTASLGGLKMPEDWNNLSKTLAHSLCDTLGDTP